MDASTKRGIIYVAAVLALVGTIAFVANIGPIASREVKLTSTTVEGDVLSVEVLPPQDNLPHRKEAVVRLASGEVVRAFVPPACVAISGQRILLARLDNDVVNIPIYVVRGISDKNDS